MSEVTIRPPDFKSEHFVKPIALQRLHCHFAHWLNTLGQNGKTSRMILGFTGPHGIGKTWLLKYLEHASELRLPKPFFFNLEDPESINDTAKIKQEINKELLHLEGKGPVLLLDNVPPPPLREPLTTFEYEVLRPCADAGALIVMALTTENNVCWYATYLRAVEPLSLKPFSEAQTQDQLAKLGTNLDSADIHNRSGGLPLLSYLFNEHNGDDQAFDDLLSYWFSRIPQSDQERIRQYLDITCLLNSIEDSKVEEIAGSPFFFAVPAFEIRNVLKKHGLTETVDDDAPLVLREAIKKAAQRRLEEENPSLYNSLMQTIQK
ncbi:MAG: hypothetical protein RBS57_14970 [Desulforhabdus sp.]|jgi:replication-associated recombination protein RarA|nr:hypothetical protein [Desulforhabdus sp.]